MGPVDSFGSLDNDIFWASHKVERNAVIQQFVPRQVN